MTAMISGAKTRISTLGVGPEARFEDCESGKGAELATLLELAEAAQLATGVVTTTRRGSRGGTERDRCELL
jgi:alkaline phosphatase